MTDKPNGQYSPDTLGGTMMVSMRCTVALALWTSGTTTSAWPPQTEVPSTGSASSLLSRPEVDVSDRLDGSRVAC